MIEYRRLALPLLLLAGCAMTPELPPINPDIPENWPEAPGYDGQQALADLPDWSDFFPDPGMQALIRQALDNNRDVRMAVARVKKAAALAGVAESNRWPGLQGSFSHQASRTPGDLSQTGQTSHVHRTDLGVTIPSFEVDFWGRLTGLRDAALERYLASEEGLRAVRVLLIAQVAEAWLTWREAAERLSLAHALVDNRRQAAELVRQRGEAGLVSQRLVLDAAANLDTTQGELAEWQRQETASRNALALLVASPEELPRDWPALAAVTLDRPLRADLPSRVLLGRPDILVAERQLRAANGDVGAARAAFLPRITLTAAGGVASRELGGLFGAGSGAWTFLPMVTLPIFDLPRRQQELDAARAEREIALNAYEKAIQQGFREVAEALALQEILQHRRDELNRVADKRQQQARQGKARFTAGLDGRLEWLEAEREWLQARHPQLTGQRQWLAGRVLLFKVLGGGQ